jgi:2-polyprenyl-6-methoxyphenol hydroxylase-like FAD-dependent oxidoreductase
LSFGPESEFEHPLGCYVAALRLRGYQPRDELTYVSFTVPERHVSRVALRDDLTLALFIWRAELVPQPPTTDREQRATLRDVFAPMNWEVPGILRRLDDVEDLYFDRVSQIRLGRWTKGRVALLGDAAACVSLLAGEGTGLAMTEAYVLADELDRSEGDYTRAFEAYERRLHPFLAKKQAGALRLLGFFAPRTKVGLKVRDWLVNATSLPIVNQLTLGPWLHDDFVLDPS